MSGDDIEDEDGLEPWLGRISTRIDFLGEVYQSQVTTDYSAGSLADLDAFLVGQYDTPADMDGEAELWLVEGAIGYLGETLLRLAGGGWRDADEPGRVYRHLPVIEADPALGLPPVSPADLVLRAVRERSEDVLRDAYAGWERAVAGYRRTHPLWTPAKRPTPGIEPDEAGIEADARYLAAWLAARERAFPDWVASYGQGMTWDFSAESMDALGALVVRLTPTLADLHAPASEAFVDGAAWYFGETLRRVKGGEWYYEQGDPEAGVYVGWPYVRQPKPYDWTAVPMRDLRLVLKRNDPYHLRKRYESFAE